jgi:cytochrome c biogenesis factor
MEKVQMQKILDRVAISASTLCMLHCLVTPLLLVAVPVISSTFMADEQFHKILVVFVLPISLIALFLGCTRHRDRIVLFLGSLGLVFLVSIAFVGHELLGEFAEKVGTVISGMILVVGHIRNYYLCRYDKCDV